MPLLIGGGIASTVVFLAFLALLLCHSTGSDERQLERVVIIGRHSVINPYPAADAAVEPGVMDVPLTSYTDRPLPSFEVPSGELTAQGRLLIRHMAAYHREHYGALLGRTPCEKVRFFADPRSRAAADSSEEFYRALFPGARCGSSPHSSGSTDELRRIFRQQPDAADIAKGCSTPTRGQLAEMLGASASSGIPGIRLYKRQLSIVQERTRCCQQEACVGIGSLCTLYGIPMVMDPNVTWRAVGGAVGTASAFAEFFVMQYCNGLDAGWGLGEEEVVDLSSLLELPLLQAGMNEITAQSVGSELMAALLHALSNDTGPNIMVYMGQKTLLHLLQKMLSLRWLSDGWWPNLAEPGSQLIFEVWRESDKRFVRVLKVAATPRQQRQASPLSVGKPPSVSYLWVPGCGGIFCPLQRFLALGRASMRPECVQAAGFSPRRDSTADETSIIGVVEPEASLAVIPSTKNAAASSAGLGVPVPESQASKVAHPFHVEPPIPTYGPTIPSMPPTVSSSGGPSSSSFFFIALCGMGCLWWRYKRKKEAASRGYEMLGGSGTPNFML